MIYKLLKDGETVNTIVASPQFVDAYCQEMGYTYELVPEPEQPDQPEPEQEATVEERVTALENAIERGLNL